MSVSFSLYGNPRPEVTVTFDGIKLDVSNKTLKKYVYNYTAIGGSDVSRLNCNKTLKVTATAANGIPKTALVLVDCKYSYNPFHSSNSMLTYAYLSYVNVIT